MRNWFLLTSLIKLSWVKSKLQFKHKAAYLTRRRRFKPMPSFTGSSPTLFLKSLPITYFAFGTSSFFASASFLVSHKFSLRYILFLKRLARKREKTLRKFWIKPFSQFYTSRLSKGARMGKGKGKKLIRVSWMPCTVNLVEFRGIRPGRLVYYRKVTSARFPVPVKLRFKYEPLRSVTVFK